MIATGSAEIVLVYFAGTLGMIFLAVAIFFFFATYQKRLLKKELEINRIKTEQQEEMLKNTVYSQEIERKRIARDLHDEVGAMLSVVKLNIFQLEKKSGEPEFKVLTKETKSYLDDVIIRVRRISRDLMPPSIEKLGLMPSIEELFNWVNKTGELKTEVWCSGRPFRFEVKKELAVFRIIQELLNNAIKHSQATIIKVNIRYTGNTLCLSFYDNGVGFDMDKMVKTGLGLKNLKSRTEILKGHIKMKSSVGKGTSAVVVFDALV